MQLHWWPPRLTGYGTVKSQRRPLNCYSYTGRLRDAKASRLEDKACILDEIGSSGSEEDVNHAIAVLISAGMSTPILRAASHSGADVRGAGFWNLGEVVIVVIVWLVQPAAHALQDVSCHGMGRVVPLLRFTQGLAWTVLFAWLGPDQKGLAAMAAGKLATAPYIAAWCAWACAAAFHEQCCERIHCHPDLFGAAILGPLMLGVSAAGVARLARVPVVGPWIVSFLLRGETGRLAEGSTSDSEAGKQAQGSTSNSEVGKLAEGSTSDSEAEHSDHKHRVLCDSSSGNIKAEFCCCSESSSVV